MSASRPRGVTLVELVMFIAILGIAMAAVFAVFNTLTARSADPQIRKQLLAIAESLMEEVQLMPFTFCDPDDLNAPTATSATLDTGGTAPGGINCKSALEVIGPESESRGHLTTPFDNVSDYHGFSMNPIQDITNTNVDGLGSYQASVSIAESALSNGTDSVPAADSLLITVTATHANGTSVALQGYRMRYAPQTLP